ncbi:hypothetical protein, partial [Thiolapillus sp.]|uniref:hypothetical protein n=1 Tax=Thiolapillus sp. TaxID=2017437 RepID=UPI003AF635EB
MKKLAEQPDDLCPAPPGANVIAWLRSSVAEARAQQLDELTATRFIDEFSFVEKFTQLHVSAFRCEGRPLPTCSPAHQDRI